MQFIFSENSKKLCALKVSMLLIVDIIFLVNMLYYGAEYLPEVGQGHQVSPPGPADDPEPACLLRETASGLYRPCRARPKECHDQEPDEDRYGSAYHRVIPVERGRASAKKHILSFNDQTRYPGPEERIQIVVDHSTKLTHVRNCRQHELIALKHIPVCKGIPLWLIQYDRSQYLTDACPEINSRASSNSKSMTRLPVSSM